VTGVEAVAVGVVVERVGRVAVEAVVDVIGSAS
jgi:hypothetical protein